MLSPDDIVFLLSGGNTNNPSLSLGGEPSATAIVSNRLFDDLEESQTRDGKTDYRCFYVHNENETETLYDAKLFIKEQTDGGATTQIGFLIRNEEQTITITGTQNGGSVTFSYDGEEFTVNYNATLAAWATLFQAALNAISGLEDVTVVATQSGTSKVFKISFIGGAGYRWHPLIALVSNDLTTFGQSVIVVSRTIAGSPKNSTTVDIERATVAPNGITFRDTSVTNPVEIGDLRPSDFVPVWVKRVTTPNTPALASDGFSFSVAGTPVV